MKGTNQNMICDNMTPEKYTYFAYGLTIESEIMMDEFQQGNGNADIEIVFGNVPQHIEGDTKGTVWFQAKKNHILITVDDIAKFYIKEGKEIVVEPYEYANLSTIKLYLHGSVFSALLYQRGLLPIHASALLIHDKCVMIAGNSGAGKSSLSITLRKKGYKVLTDDIVALDFSNDIIQAAPGFPLQKVTLKTAKELGIDTSNLEQIEYEEKYLYPIESGFYDKKVQPDIMIELIPYEGDDVIIEQIQGADKLAIIISNSYSLQFADCLGVAKEHFNHCAQLANNIKLYKLYRPNQGFTVEEQIECIMNIL